jgi:hypothetical protein
VKRRKYRVKLNIVKRKPLPREEPIPKEMDVLAISEEDASSIVRNLHSNADTYATIRSILEV